MSGSPFRERTIPADEVRRIVKRAWDLAATEPAGTSVGPALTRKNLAERLAELGFSAETAARAIDGTAQSVHPSADNAMRVVREAVIEGTVPPERHEDIADAIVSVMQMQGRVSVVGNKLTWVPGGVLTEPAVIVHSKNGRTRIHYVETLASRGQMTLGFGIVAGLGGMIAGCAALFGGIAISKAAEISARQGAPAVFAMAAIFGVAAAIASMFGLRRSFARRVQNRSAFADEVQARVLNAVREAIEASPARMRVVVPAGADEASVEETDELESGEGPRRIGRVDR